MYYVVIRSRRSTKLFEFEKLKNENNKLILEYVIPDLRLIQCDQLWDDFILFYEGVLKDGEQYFLGNIVVFKEKDKFFVIDGQQRLTTLLLFIKIFLIMLVL